MQVADWIILAVVAWFAYKGYRKGLLIELLGTVSLVVAVCAGFLLLDRGVNFLSSQFNITGPWLAYVAFFIIFVLVVTVLSFIARQIKKVVHSTILADVDRWAGGAFGVLKATFLVSLFFWLTQMLSIDLPFGTHGMVASFVKPLAPAVVSLLTGLWPNLQGITERLTQYFA